MRVILTEKVPALGNVGEIVKVSAGHARNYLLPNRLAILADEKNKKVLADQQRRLQKKVDEAKNAAVEVKNKIEGISIELTKKVGGSGKLFGTVTNTELAAELAKLDIEVERRLIIIDEPIKQTGSFEVKVKLFKEVDATLKVNVTMDPKQIEEMKKKQEEAERKAKKAKEAKAQAAEAGTEDATGPEAEASEEGEAKDETEA